MLDMNIASRGKYRKKENISFCKNIKDPFFNTRKGPNNSDWSNIFCIVNSYFQLMLFLICKRSIILILLLPQTVDEIQIPSEDPEIKNHTK